MTKPAFARATQPKTFHIRLGTATAIVAAAAMLASLISCAPVAGTKEAPTGPQQALSIPGNAKIGAAFGSSGAVLVSINAPIDDYCVTRVLIPADMAARHTYTLVAKDKQGQDVAGRIMRASLPERPCLLTTIYEKPSREIVQFDLVGAPPQAANQPAAKHAAAAKAKGEGWSAETAIVQLDGTARLDSIPADYGQTDLMSTDYDLGHPRLRVTTPNSSHTWAMRLLPVEELQYPHLVLTYKARNIKPEPYTGLELYRTFDGQMPSNQAVQKVMFRCDEFICDGQVHELHHDLREYSAKAVATNIWIRLFSTADASASNPAEMEVLGLRMEAAEVQPTIQEEKPLSVKVTDTKGNPLAGATVTIDAFTNRARSAQSGSDGTAKVTPLANALGYHRLQISKPGKATLLFLSEEHDPLPSVVEMPEMGRYSGVVRDAQGKGVAGVCLVLMYEMAGASSFANEMIFSDERGQWQAVDLPAGIDAFRVRLFHPDYPVVKSFQDVSGDAAREGKAVLKIGREKKATGGAPVPPDTRF